MDDGVGTSPTPVADMANGESLQMLVRQKHSKEGSSATNSVCNTTRGRTSLGLRPWQQPVPLPPSTLDSLVRTKSLAGSPHGAGFGEISASQEEAVLTKVKEEVGEFDMEKIIVEDEGYGSRDDQSEEKKSSFWQDLWSSPSAQLKRLVRTPWKGGIPPFWVDSNVQGTPSRGRGTPSRGRGGRGSKAKRGRGVPRGKPAKHGGLWGAISQIRKSDAAIKEFENQFLSDSSKGPKASRTTLVTELLKKINEPKPMVPLTCRSLKALSTAFWKAGYKSAEAYLVEAKQLHVEAGHEWSQLLDFTYKKCKTGVSRNRGPRKKAPEVGAKVRKECQHRILPRKVPVWYPKELFRFAMVWMLRSIELMEVKAKDITVDATNKRITLYWYKDKKDQMAGGTTRVLACLCSSSTCDVECPYLSSQFGATPQSGQIPRWEWGLVLAEERFEPCAGYKVPNHKRLEHGLQHGCDWTQWSQNRCAQLHQDGMGNSSSCLSWSLEVRCDLQLCSRSTSMQTCERSTNIGKGYR